VASLTTACSTLGFHRRDRCSTWRPIVIF